MTPRTIRAIPTKKDGFIYLNLLCLKRVPTADDPDQQYHNSKNQQNMHISADCINAGDAEQPQDDKNYKNGPKHKFNLLVFKHSIVYGRNSAVWKRKIFCLLLPEDRLV